MDRSLLERLANNLPEALPELCLRAQDRRIAKGLIELITQTPPERWSSKVKPQLLLALFLIFRHGQLEDAKPLRVPFGGPEVRMASWLFHYQEKLAEALAFRRRWSELEAPELSEALFQATASVRAQDEPEALELLLGAWRQRRDPRLARIIEVLSDRIRARRPALPERKAKPAWLSLAERRDPADLGRLLDHVRPSGKGLLERVEQLNTWAPDPRIAAALCELLEGKQRPAALLTISLGLLLHADPRSLKTLELFFEPLLCEVRSALQAELEGLKELEGLEELEALIGRRRARRPKDVEQELQAAVHESPEDDAPRLIYADWLMERGDPRGEFIVLQLEKTRRALSEPEAQREAELLAKHALRWLGPIAPLVVSAPERVEYRRGFLSACAVDLRDADRARRLCGHPAWVTLEATRLVGWSDAARPLLALPALKMIVNLSAEAALALCQQERAAVETLELSLTQEEALADALVDALEQRCALARLRALYVSDSPEHVHGALCARRDRLERFGLSRSPLMNDRGALRDWLRAARDVAPKVHAIELLQSPLRWDRGPARLSWALDAKGRRVELIAQLGDGDPEDLCWAVARMLEALPKDGLERLQLVDGAWPTTKRALRPLRRALRRFDEVRIEPAPG